MDGVVVGTASTVLAAVASQIAAFLLFDVKYPSSGKDYYNLVHVEILELKDRNVKHTMKSLRILGSLNEMKLIS